jgi:hypothetical protein
MRLMNTVDLNELAKLVVLLISGFIPGVSYQSAVL